MTTTNQKTAMVKATTSQQKAMMRSTTSTNMTVKKRTQNRVGKGQLWIQRVVKRHIPLSYSLLLLNRNN